MELQIFEKFLKIPPNFKTIELIIENIETNNNMELNYILSDIKSYNKSVFESADLAKKRGDSIASRLQRFIISYEETLEDYRQALETMEAKCDITRLNPICIIGQIL